MLQVRRATVEDKEAACELLFGLKGIYGSRSEASLSEFTNNYGPAYDRAMRDPGHSIWVATLPSVPLAGYLSTTRRLVLRLGGDVGVVEEIFVRSEFRRMGIGYALWQAAMNELRENGIRTVEMVTSLAHPGQRSFSKKIGLEWYSNIHRVQF